MELCDAGTMKSHMASHKPLQETDIQFFFVQLGPLLIKVNCQPFPLLPVHATSDLPQFAD
jgi:hypothetical protein